MSVKIIRQKVLVNISSQGGEIILYVDADGTPRLEGGGECNGNSRVVFELAAAGTNLFYWDGDAGIWCACPCHQASPAGYVSIELKH